MKILKKISYLVILCSFISCQGLVEDTNDTPNKAKEVDGKDLFIGIQIANISAQDGYLAWASSIWSGYFVGESKLAPIQNYQYVNTNSNTPWRNIYQGVVSQARNLRSGKLKVSNKDFFFGTSMVLEAHAIGTATNLFGDIPFSEAINMKVVNPKYDKQTAIYNSLQSLLDKAIVSLNNSKTTGGISDDLMFGGNSSKWVKTAHTLKARLYLDVRNYSKALEEVKKGISKKDETMYYKPPAETMNGDFNLLNGFFNGSYKEDLAIENSHINNLLTGSKNRNNSKTNEASRINYYYTQKKINKDEGGIAGVKEPMPLISLEENILIWAECLLRGGDFSASLSKLNEHRKNLKDGLYFKISSPAKYDPYLEADFEKGGIENADSKLSKEDALLREIIEERYVTFFTKVLGFNDLRRYKKDKIEVQVAVPINKGDKHPERFLYPFSEESANSSIPKNITLFTKTEINK